MKKIAIVYASKQGHTRKIAAYMAGKLQERGFSTQLIDAASEGPLPSTVDAVIAGSPVYAGKFRSTLLRWVHAHHAELARLPFGLFSVTLNAADQHLSAPPHDQRLLRELISACGIVPGHLASIAGALKYREYSWPVRRMMRNIAEKAGGDLDTSRDYEYTNWAYVDAFLDAFTGQKLRSPFATAVRFPAYKAMDQHMPLFEQHWSREITVERPAGEVFKALRTLPASEMRLARVLTWIRTLGKKDETPAGEPFLKSAERFGNMLIPTEEPRELIAGLVGRFWELNFGVKRMAPAEFASFSEPGYAKVLCNFLVEDIPGTSSSKVRSEFRVHCTSPDAARKFAFYWALLGPGIRLYMGSALAALKRKAEALPVSSGFGTVPGHSLQEESHPAPASGAGKAEPRPHERGHREEPRMHEHTQQGA